MGAPLEGVRVLDLTQNLPGPFCTLVLADLGADVVKVEPPGGDPMRRFPPFVGSVSAGHLTVNRDKRSVVVDLKAPGGRGVLLRLARGADVLVEGFRPGTLDRLGVGHAALRAANPRLVVCAITGHGQDGPRAGVAGHDLNYLADAGVLGLAGRAGHDGPPAPLPVQVADLAAGGLFAAVGVLAALAGRERSGEGTVVDTSMTDGAMALLSIHLGGLLAGGPEPRRGEGFLAGGAAWYDVYACADGGEIALGAVEPKFFARACALLGVPELAARQFDSEPGAQDDVRARLAAVFATRPRDAWAALLDGQDTCASPVLGVAEAVDRRRDELAARGMLVTVDVPGHGPVPTLGTPLRLAGHARPSGRPPAELGADTDAVLAEHGFAAGEVAALRAAGAVAGP